MYEGFASMYDALMHDAPYEIWAAYIDGFLSEWFKGKKGYKGIILDIACGTGNITLRLAEMGYDMIGVDSSEEMLAEACRKAHEKNAEILFLAQDMRELNLYGTVDAAVCVCDGLNYILNADELLEIFKKIKLFLNPGGVFIFDMNTEYKFENFAKQIFEDTGAGGESYEWQNNYEPSTKINEYNMVFFMYDKNGNRTEDEAFTELHRQKAYPLADICNLLLKAGFASVAMRDSYSNNPPKPESTRVVFIAAM
ncbi:MAG: class I SAM-dependent methyltransferase [Defluviitaleaceae bacterium]|nr:class I SAM-dependent methyltransferase [Defluviitaleaceae bacterium]